MKLNVLNLKAEKTKELEIDWPSGKVASDGLILQVLSVLKENRRKNSAVTQTRGEVSGGGKKPWRQKGTGRARQGSTRSPIWRGGGVSHGPTGLRRSRHTNKKVVGQALLAAFRSKADAHQILVLEDQPSPLTKSRQIAALFSKLKLGNSQSLVITEEAGLTRTARNLKNVHLASPQNFNLYQLLKCNKIVLLESDLGRIRKRFGI